MSTVPMLAVCRFPDIAPPKNRPIGIRSLVIATG
jgi:hypothetical protein